MRIPYGPASTGPLYQAYTIWCKWNGIGKPVSKRSFALRGTSKRNFARGKTRATRFVIPPEFTELDHWTLAKLVDEFDEAVKEYVDRKDA